MRPKKKRVGHEEQPDAVKDETVDSVGGTNGEKMGDDEDWGKTSTPEEDAVDYGRPEEVDEDEYI